jgi:hypothetical protein
VQIFSARSRAPSPRLQFRPFEFDMQRVHEPVHQAAKGGNRRQLDDLGVVKMFGKLCECIVVIARLVPRYELGPSNDRLLPLAE